jgi:hypothetical protein
VGVVKEQTFGEGLVKTVLAKFPCLVGIFLIYKLYKMLSSF